MSTLTNPVFVAIDTPLRDAATATLKMVAPHVGGYKIGLEYFCANGGAIGVSDLFAATGLPVFLDLKFHDIANTVGRAIKGACAELPHPPAIMTVHAAGGSAMLKAARNAAPPETKVVAVTMLTSLEQRDLNDMGFGQDSEDYVRNLAWIAQHAGIDGIVCSGQEVQWIKEEWPDGFIVVPGIRPEGVGQDDQKRVVTPKEALERGADVLVIGRPITGAKNPVKAAQEIYATLV